MDSMIKKVLFILILLFASISVNAQVIEYTNYRLKYDEFGECVTNKDNWEVHAKITLDTNSLKIATKNYGTVVIQYDTVSDIIPLRNDDYSPKMIGFFKDGKNVFKIILSEDDDFVMLVYLKPKGTIVYFKDIEDIISL